LLSLAKTQSLQHFEKVIVFFFACFAPVLKNKCENIFIPEPSLDILIQLRKDNVKQDNYFFVGFIEAVR